MDSGCLIARCTHTKIANPANRKTGTGKVGFGESDVRKRQLKIGTIFDLLGFQCCTLKGGYRNRNILGALRLPLCGDDNDVIINDPIVTVLRHGGY